MAHAWTPSIRRPTWPAAAIVLAIGLSGASAGAQAAPNGGGVTPAAAAPRLVEVRLAMSGVASQKLVEPRVRRLLEIELEDNAILAPGASGPLGDHVAYVWIDLPTPSSVLMEVRIGERPVSRRELQIAGLTFDVAARFVAIAASEMVREQMRPVRPPRKPPPPKGPSPAELERAARDAPAIFYTGSGSFAVLPAQAAFLAGPSLSLGYRNRRASEGVFGRLLAGTADGGPLRWLEVGLTGDYRLWLDPGWRLTAGVAAALSSVRVTDVRAVDGIAGERDTWSARAGLVLGAEVRVLPAGWLGLSLEPGAILRPARYMDHAGADGAVEGAWLGATLTLQLER